VSQLAIERAGERNDVFGLFFSDWRNERHGGVNYFTFDAIELSATCWYSRLNSGFFAVSVSASNATTPGTGRSLDHIDDLLIVDSEAFQEAGAIDHSDVAVDIAPRKPSWNFRERE
jgi:hypothetical protein